MLSFPLLQVRDVSGQHPASVWSGRGGGYVNSSYTIEQEESLGC